MLAEIHRETQRHLTICVVFRFFLVFIFSSHWESARYRSWESHVIDQFSLTD